MEPNAVAAYSQEELSDELRASHADLSQADLRFREFARTDPESLDRSTFRELVDPNPLLTYERQPWPTFIGTVRNAELAKASVAISSLIRQIPERVFGNDPEKIAGFYGLQREFIEIMLQPPNGIAEGLSRGDFVVGRTGFKCIEFNMTSNLGGWETGYLASVTLRIPPIARFLRETGIQVRFKDTFRLTLAHAIRGAVRAGLHDGNEVNVVIASRVANKVQTPLVQQFLARDYDAALRDVDPALRGTLAIMNYADAQERNGRLYMGTRRVHALIERHVDSTEAAPFRAFKLGNLHLYNGPTSWILSDKRNLALLSENQESSLLGEEEREVIRNYIPWTRRIVTSETEFHGRSRSMHELLLAERDVMVLKKSRSMGGADVVLGRFSTLEQWKQAVAQCFQEGNWIAQELVESRPYLYQAGDYGCVPHDSVWGPFVCGTTYAGTILRVQPKALEGIVNLTRGATEGILLEVAD